MSCAAARHRTLNPASDQRDDLHSEGVKKSTCRMSPAAPHPIRPRRERAIERRNSHVYLPLNEEDALTSHADRSPSPSRERVGVRGLPAMSNRSISSQPIRMTTTELWRETS